MAKLLFVDTETTGLDERRHGIVELAGVVEIDGKIVNKFNYQVRPFETDEIEDEALEITGFKREDIVNWEDPIKIHEVFSELLGTYVDRYNKKDKFSIVAYNAMFDDRFLRVWFEKCKDIYYGSFISYPPIDVAVLAGAALIEKRPQFTDFKLMTVAKELGILLDESKAHSAFYDIAITYKIFKKLQIKIQGE